MPWETQFNKIDNHILKGGAFKEHICPKNLVIVRVS